MKKVNVCAFFFFMLPIAPATQACFDFLKETAAICDQYDEDNMPDSPMFYQLGATAYYHARNAERKSAQKKAAPIVPKPGKPVATNSKKPAASQPKSSDKK